MNRSLWPVRSGATMLAAVLFAASPLGLTGCQRGASDAAAPATAGASAAPSGTVGTAATQTARLQLAPTDVLTVQRGVLLRGVAISGTLQAVDRATVKAKAAGELLHLDVREGDSVRAGQIIARIDDTEAELRVRQAERQADAARAQLDIAQRTLNNNQALERQGFISATALETATANAAAARANLEAAQAAVDLARRARDDAAVKAPINGRVARRLAQPGERLAVGAGVVEIVDLTRLELAAAVPPDDAPTLRVGAPARLQVEGQGRELAAQVQRINPVAAPGSRAVTAYLGLAGTQGLQEGLFANGWIELDRRETLNVPASAIRLDAAKPYVVRVENGVAEHQIVELGVRGRRLDGLEAVEITSGLVGGALVLDATTGKVPHGKPVQLPPTPASTLAAADAAADASVLRR